MSAFHDEQLHHLHFLVNEEAGAPKSLVPLVHDSGEQRCLLYGGSYPDARVLWMDYGEFPDYFEQLPEGMRWKADWDMQSETAAPCASPRRPPNPPRPDQWGWDFQMTGPL